MAFCAQSCLHHWNRFSRVCQGFCIAAPTLPSILVDSPFPVQWTVLEAPFIVALWLDTQCNILWTWLVLSSWDWLIVLINKCLPSHVTRLFIMWVVCMTIQIGCNTKNTQVIIYCHELDLLTLFSVKNQLWLHDGSCLLILRILKCLAVLSSYLYNKPVIEHKHC